MGLKNLRYNKLIDVHFLDDNGKDMKAIICPENGQKPSIEIVGQYVTGDSIPRLSVTIKNFYLDAVGKEYPKIKISAGYGKQKKDFVCSIFSIYQESPGPEGSTIIQCAPGELNQWLKATVNAHVDAGGSLKDAVTAISDAVEGLDSPQIDDGVANMKSETQIDFNGVAHEELRKVRKAFPDAIISVTGNRIVCWSRKDPAPKTKRKVDFMSAPPQLTGGGKNATAAVITAPWDPDMRCGDLVEFPTKYYGGRSGNVTKESETMTIVAYSVQFQFSTTGNANKMVVSGTVVDE